MPKLDREEATDLGSGVFVRSTVHKSNSLSGQTIEIELPPARQGWARLRINLAHYFDGAGSTNVIAHVYTWHTEIAGEPQVDRRISPPGGVVMAIPLAFPNGHRDLK